MEKATSVVLIALSVFALVLVAYLFQGAGINNAVEGLLRFDMEQIKRGALLFTIGAAILTTLGTLVAIFRAK